MESRLFAIKGLFPALFANGSYRCNFMLPGVAVIHTRILTDPLIHSGKPDEAEVEAAEQAKAAESQREYKPTDKTNPLVPPKPPVSPSPKLENTLNPPTNPTTQQKRHIASSAGVDSKPPSLTEVGCVGLDGSPWSEEEAKRERRRHRKEQEEDDKEYFKHHKASPLSEIEVADTRKPVSRVTDGTADSYVEGGGGNVVLFSEEQRDSAEEALRRAVEMWRERAMRGDPDSPHGRVLRELRGESW